MGGPAGEAQAALQSGDLAGAQAKLIAAVRAKPADAALRVFLFQLFCVTGAYQRALAQASTAATLDPAAIPMAQTYRALIQCEALRAKVFTGERTPTVFGDPEPWLSHLLQVLPTLAAGRPAEAAALRDQAFADAPELTGTLNGEAFSWIADADPRLGPVLEVMLEGRYVWVPFHRIRQISLEAPADLRDRVWMPATFTWTNGGEAVGFIPARYPGSEAAEPALALGRRTQWQDDETWPICTGQRMLATDLGEVALFDARDITTQLSV